MRRSATVPNRSMRSVVILIVLALIAVIASADDTDPEDLGVLTPRRGIILERNNSRPDFSHFIVDLVSLAPTSNHITLTLTNDLLTITNLVRLPSGRVLMGLLPVYTDGLKGEIQLYSFDLRRGRPPKASARMIGLLGGPEVIGATNVHQVMEQRRRARPTNAPPLPAQSTSTNALGAGAGEGLPSPPFRGSLPNGKPETYADHLDAEAEKHMKQFYAQRRAIK